MIKIDEENMQNQQIPVLFAQNKLSKQQILKYNIPLLLSEYLKQINDEINLRESSNKLQSLASLYLKQHQYLKQEVEGLKNTLYNIDEYKKDQNIEKAGEKKKPAKNIKEIQHNNDFSSPDSSFVYQDNARNISSDQKIQLTNQGSKLKINFLEPEKQIEEEQQGPLEFQMKNIIEIQKRPLKEIILERQNIKKQKQQNAQSIPEIVLNPPIEENQSIILEEKPSQIDIDLTFDGQRKKGALESFVKQIQEKQSFLEPKKKREKKNKFIEFDEKINEDIDTNYKVNVQQLTEQQQKIQNLKQRMQQTNLENEFWNSKQGGLLDLINHLELDNEVKRPQIPEKKINQSQNEQFSKQNEVQSQQDRFLDFEKFSIENPHEDNKSFIEIQASSYDAIKKIEKKYGKDNEIDIEQYFALSDDSEKTNKSKAFYDLMILSRVGAIKIQQTQTVDKFPEIQLKI